jgi:hypothetical protein
MYCNEVDLDTFLQGPYVLTMTSPEIFRRPRFSTYLYCTLKDKRELSPSKEGLQDPQNGALVGHHHHVGVTRKLS